MLVGDVIRKYRKQVGITQEEMARRLGVTTPAVNKWENNNTQPDIALLAPIARLLGITTDTLLSFRDSLSSEEIAAFVKKLDQDLETREYAEVFTEAKKTLEEYPNCDQLIWQTAVIFQARRNIDQIRDKEKYDDIIYGWLERCLQSEDGNIRKEAAGSLFYAYLQNPTLLWTVRNENVKKQLFSARPGKSKRLTVLTKSCSLPTISSSVWY